MDRYNGHGATLSPDGAILAMLGSGGKLELRNVSSRTLIKSLPVAGELEDAAFSHDGTKLATAKGRLVQFWDISSGRLLHEFRGHADGVFAVVFSLDDQSIISAGFDATIRIWSIADRMQSGVHLGHTGRIWNLARSPDGPTNGISRQRRDGQALGYQTEPRLHQASPRCSKLFCLHTRRTNAGDPGRP